MPIYKIAFGVVVVLVTVLAFMQVTLRRQAHEATYGNQGISPRDVRYANSLLGQNGIWNLHKRAYKRSGLRSLFLIVSGMVVLSFLVALCDFLYVVR